MTVIVDADFSGMGGVLGVISGIAKGSQVYNSALVEMAEEAATKEFNDAADLYTNTTGQLRHVYEPGLNGVKGSRLWNIRVTSGAGGSRSGNRNVTYTFKTSKVKSPNTPESTGIPANKFPSKVRQKSRVPFYNRAMVLELGNTITISPKYSKALFVPLWDQTPLPQRNKAKGPKYFYFTRQPTTFTPTKYAGNFSTFWLSWWSEEAPKVVKQTIERQAYGDISAIAQAGFASNRKRTRSFKLAIQDGEAYAQNAMSKAAEKIR